MGDRHNGDRSTKWLSSAPAPQALSQESKYLYLADNCGALGSLCIRVMNSDGPVLQAHHLAQLK